MGLHGGLLAYNAFDLVDPERPVYRSEWRGLPELLLRLGPVSPARLELGLGSFNLPTITRPGAYLGLGFSGPAGSGWDLALHYAFVDNLNTIDYTRWDAELRAPVTDRLRVGAGVAVTSGFEGRIEPEGRLVMDFVLANPAGE